ncbi:MAG: GNAT family N-acetyltransferase [Candidatus Peribacteraceae bacterium]|nr:GNAT family N-acetyltransferase [Candidatus Peribacteraceae bacterium]
MIIEKTTMDDIDYIMTWINHPEVTQYFAGLNNDISREDEAKYLQALITSDKDEVYSIFSDSKEYLGQISINRIYRHPDGVGGEGRLFVVIKPGFNGRSYAQEAISKILKIAFTELDLNRVHLIVRQDSFKALHLYHKCGFRQEGVLQQKYRLDREYLDMILMAITKDLWWRWSGEYKN